eukprot:NODE_11911_length_1258_cov_5.684350.p1 GENE.NODE_11911_length_1258_cov_5.684350~~NODE_11911_length_1258_cov_5.684350.p1  ORF type:complete len:174 (+),score=46.48 NODE_11911_length_1258_cov_5.684350:702-1223(+)
MAAWCCRPTAKDHVLQRTLQPAAEHLDIGNALEHNSAISRFGACAQRGGGGTASLLQSLSMTPIDDDAKLTQAASGTNNPYLQLQKPPPPRSKKPCLTIRCPKMKVACGSRPGLPQHNSVHNYEIRMPEKKKKKKKKKKTNKKNNKKKNKTKKKKKNKKMKKKEKNSNKKTTK